MTLDAKPLVGLVTPMPTGFRCEKKQGITLKKSVEKLVILAVVRWQLSKSVTRFKASRYYIAYMSQPNIKKLISKARAIKESSEKCTSTNAEPGMSAPGAVGFAIQPSANLLEILHARNLRATLAQQVVRLEEQSCAISWCVGMADFESLYCDSTRPPMRDPLNADEVRSHYTDLLVAMDHLLVQLGDTPAER